MTAVLLVTLGTLITISIVSTSSTKNSSGTTMPVGASSTSTPEPRSSATKTKTAKPSPASPAVANLLPSVNPGTPARSKTTRVFSDEFTGTVLDPSKWSTGRYARTTPGDGPFNPKLEAAYYASSQVSVSEGSAHLIIAPSQASIDGKSYNFVSGLIQSENHFALTPGTYVEARIKINECSGCWNAFWAQPSGRWPPEIDIFEFFQPESAPKYNFHPETGGQSGPAAYGEPKTSYFGEYHTYGMLWDGVRATPYLDGKPYKAQPASTRVPLYLIINLALYDGFSPAAGSSMEIDWVRAWH